MALDGKGVRTWQEIASDASQEKDPVKLRALAQELEKAFAERDAKLGIGPKSSAAQYLFRLRRSPLAFSCLDSLKGTLVSRLGSHVRGCKSARRFVFSKGDSTVVSCLGFLADC